MSDLVGNPEDWFSHNKAQLLASLKAALNVVTSLTFSMLEATAGPTEDDSLRSKNETTSCLPLSQCPCPISSRH